MYFLTMREFGHSISILLHSCLNPAWHFWLSTKFSWCPNQFRTFKGIFENNFTDFREAVSLNYYKAKKNTRRRRLVSSSPCLNLNMECSISQDSDVSSTPCGHLFHSACLSRATVVTKTCPSCRSSCNQRVSIHRVYLSLQSEQKVWTEREKNYFQTFAKR